MTITYRLRVRARAYAFAGDRRDVRNERRRGFGAAGQLYRRASRKPRAWGGLGL